MRYINSITRDQFTGEWADTVQQVMREDARIAYLVTVSFVDFNPTATSVKSSLEQKNDYAWKHYTPFNRHLNSKLESNFTRKFHLLPWAVDFFDVPGTSHSHQSSSYEPKTPHIHSIYLVHPANHVKFKNLAQNRFDIIVEHPSQKAVMQAHAIPIEPTREHLRHVVSYASKLLFDPSSLHLPDKTILYTQHPITRSERKTRTSCKETFFHDPRQALFNASKAKMQQRFGSTTNSR